MKSSGVLRHSFFAAVFMQGNMLAWLAFIWMCDLFNTLSTGGLEGGREETVGLVGSCSFTAASFFFSMFVKMPREQLRIMGE